MPVCSFRVSWHSVTLMEWCLWCLCIGHSRVIMSLSMPVIAFFVDAILSIVDYGEMQSKRSYSWVWNFIRHLITAQQFIILLDRISQLLEVITANLYLQQTAKLRPSCDIKLYQCAFASIWPTQCGLTSESRPSCLNTLPTPPYWPF